MGAMGATEVHGMEIFKASVGIRKLGTCEFEGLLRFELLWPVVPDHEKVSDWVGCGFDSGVVIVYPSALTTVRCRESFPLGGLFQKP